MRLLFFLILDDMLHLFVLGEAKSPKLSSIQASTPKPNACVICSPDGGASIK